MKYVFTTDPRLQRHAALDVYLPAMWLFLSCSNLRTPDEFARIVSPQASVTLLSKQ